VTMGAFSPALGMIGTLIGLVQMLQSMEDPSKIGPAMAVALMTTFYGSIIANICFLPIAGKAQDPQQGRSAGQGDDPARDHFPFKRGQPRILEQKLKAFIPTGEKKGS
jgi:chemotaxis protein MotA